MPGGRPKRQPPKPKRRTRGSGSISKSADGTIRARLPAAIDPGRAAREFPPGQIKAAEAWLDVALNPQVTPAVEVPDVATWAARWWETYIQPIYAPNTAHTYAAHLRHLGPVRTVPLPELTTLALQQVAGVLAQRVSPAAVEAYVGTWKRCFEAAVEDGLIARNPARRLKTPAIPKSRLPRRYVTAAEVGVLRGAIVGHRFEAAYALLLGCGLRIGEVLGLPWAHVDLHGRKAWISRQWTNFHWRELPKNSAPRWISLPPMVVAALIRHRNSQPEGCTLVMQSPSQPHGRGKKKSQSAEPRPWSRSQVAADLREIVSRLELDPLTPHAARRGLLTALLDGGVSPATAAAIVGHDDPSTTLRFYVQASDEGRKLAAELTNQYLGENAQEGEQQSS